MISLSLGGTEEHEDLTRSLGLIKGTIVQVDALVNLHEKNCRLRDIHSKMEPKALGKIKDGRVFRREDLAQGRRRMLHDGTVNWKAASGRLKGDDQTRSTCVSCLLSSTLFPACKLKSKGVIFGFLCLQIFLQCFCQMYCSCYKRRIRDMYLLQWYVNSLNCVCTI